MSAPGTPPAGFATAGTEPRVYELVLREGVPNDVLACVDGALLVDLWDDLVWPVGFRAAQNRVVTRRGRRAGRLMDQPDNLTTRQVDVAGIFGCKASRAAISWPEVPRCWPPA